MFNNKKYFNSFWFFIYRNVLAYWHHCINISSQRNRKQSFKTHLLKVTAQWWKGAICPTTLKSSVVFLFICQTLTQMPSCEPQFPTAAAGSLAASLSGCSAPLIMSVGLTHHYAADGCSGLLCPSVSLVPLTNMFAQILLILLIYY